MCINPFKKVPHVNTAAEQGIIAGINSSCYILNEDPLILKRSDAYIGVLIDDLILKDTNEPY